jgi:hypothetical protein
MITAENATVGSDNLRFWKRDVTAPDVTDLG